MPKRKKKDRGRREKVEFCSKCGEPLEPYNSGLRRDERLRTFVLVAGCPKCDGSEIIEKFVGKRRVDDWRNRKSKKKK